MWALGSFFSCCESSSNEVSRLETRILGEFIITSHFIELEGTVKKGKVSSWREKIKINYLWHYLKIILKNGGNLYGIYMEKLRTRTVSGNGNSGYVGCGRETATRTQSQWKLYAELNLISRSSWRRRGRSIFTHVCFIPTGTNAVQGQLAVFNRLETSNGVVGLGSFHYWMAG